MLRSTNHYVIAALSFSEILFFIRDTDVAAMSRIGRRVIASLAPTTGRQLFRTFTRNFVTPVDSRFEAKRTEGPTATTLRNSALSYR